MFKPTSRQTSSSPSPLLCVISAADIFSRGPNTHHLASNCTMRFVRSLYNTRYPQSAKPIHQLARPGVPVDSNAIGLCQLHTLTPHSIAPLHNVLRIAFAAPIGCTTIATADAVAVLCRGGGLGGGFLDLGGRAVGFAGHVCDSGFGVSICVACW